MESRSKLTRTILIILTIPLYCAGFLYISHLSIVNSDKVQAIYKKYQSTKIKELCDWGAENGLLNCYQDDFYAFLRSADPYEGYLAFEVLQELYERDKVLHTSKRGQFLMHLTYLELLYTFFKLSEETRVDRKNLKMGGRMLVYFVRDTPLRALYQSNDVLNELHELKEQVKTSKTERNRLRLLRGNLNSLIDKALPLKKDKSRPLSNLDQLDL